MTAPCRCRDLRRALLGLVRVELDESSDSFDLADQVNRARRLLRETRQEKQSEVIDPDLAVMAPGDIAAKLNALNRIMEAWFAEDDGVPFGDDPLHKVLESVAREFGFGGEDGGSK